MTTKTVDEWAAEQCGLCVMTGLDDKEYFYRPNTTEPPYDFEWTIQDPRCREIFRDWWLSKDTSNAVLIFNDEVTYFRDYAYGQGDPTTRDTEEACITAIFEASQ